VGSGVSRQVIFLKCFMVRSRLARKTDQKTKKNLLFNILGIILIIFLAFKFGIPLLANLSSFLSGSKTNQELLNSNNPSFIAPPILDSFPEATASAEIIISGIASENQLIDLYINGNLVNTTKTGDNGRFSFNEVINPGENTIKTKAIAGDKESNFSNTIITAFKSAPPSLNIISPTNDQSFEKDQNFVDIRGTTDVDAKITVNGFWAITDGNGNFSYRLPLQNGDNNIIIISTDAAGNNTEKNMKVTYSP